MAAVPGQAKRLVPPVEAKQFTAAAVAAAAVIRLVRPHMLPVPTVAVGVYTLPGALAPLFRLVPLVLLARLGRLVSVAAAVAAAALLQRLLVQEDPEACPVVVEAAGAQH